MPIIYLFIYLILLIYNFTFVNLSYWQIGTGQQGTVQGRVYARVSDWFPGEKGWLACVQDKLYYRSLSIEPASLVVLDTATLEVFSFPFFLFVSGERGKWKIGRVALFAS